MKSLSPFSSLSLEQLEIKINQKIESSCLDAEYIDLLSSYDAKIKKK